MPVSTLRIWERRYRVVSPATTPSGHRLYSAADVQRLALVKQLTEVGHAIGSIAALDRAELQRVASTHASALAGAREPLAPWRVVVVGAALARRLQQPALAHRLGRPLEVCAVVDDLAAAEAAGAGQRADGLLVHAPRLHLDSLAAVRTVMAGWGIRQTAILYGYASAPTCRSFDAAGVALLREPQDDAALAGWLRGIDASSVGTSPAPNPAGDPTWESIGSAAPRRYDDATLADFAGLSSTIACECPRHVAELLMQLSHFEAYSAECASRSPGDAALHAYLQRVAGASRSLFESALERVAIQEGLVLPPR